jgi:acetylglutamate/LysW-gamma-L-alpha-aminoadipate kinase
MDGGLLQGRRKEAIRYIENGKVKVLRDDHTGTVETVNTHLLELLMKGGYIPLVTIPIESEDHGALNADADRVAASIATAMKADTLILLTNKPGLLKDVEDPSSIIRSVSRNNIDDAMDIAEGRMKKKILAAREAIEGGVGMVVVSSANVEGPLTRALKGEGTVIC